MCHYMHVEVREQPQSSVSTLFETGSLCFFLLCVYRLTGVQASRKSLVSTPHFPIGTQGLDI